MITAEFDKAGTEATPTHLAPHTSPRDLEPSLSTNPLALCTRRLVISVTFEIIIWT